MISEVLTESKLSDVLTSNEVKNLASLLKKFFSNGAKIHSLVLMVLFNAKNFAYAHYPELCYSWLASLDSNYYKGREAETPSSDKVWKSYSATGYRIVYINCPVDIEVLNAGGQTIAKIANDEVVESEEYTLHFGTDFDGQKFIVLPNDGYYTVNITARENTDVSVNINELSFEKNGYERSVNYFDINLKKGKTLTGTLPEFSESDIESGAIGGSNVNYLLRDQNNNAIPVSSEMRGQESRTAIFEVLATSSDINCGIVVGGGIKPFGEFVSLNAQPEEGFVFAGWYDESNTLVSNEQSYRFRVTANTSFVGKFIDEKDADMISKTSERKTVAIIVITVGMILIISVAITLICINSRKKKFNRTKTL